MRLNRPDAESTSRSEGVLGRARRSLALRPETRLYPTLRLDLVMIACGTTMLGGGILSAASGGSPLMLFSATLGFGFILVALSDLLVGRPGARRAVLALRAVAWVSLAGFVLGYAWETAKGNGLASFALAAGFCIAAIAYAAKKANASRP